MEIEPPDPSTWIIVDSLPDGELSDMQAAALARMACLTNSFAHANLTRLSTPARPPVSRPEIRDYHGEPS